VCPRKLRFGPGGISLVDLFFRGASDASNRSTTAAAIRLAPSPIPAILNPTVPTDQIRIKDYQLSTLDTADRAEPMTCYSRASNPLVGPSLKSIQITPGGHRTLP